MTFECSSCHMRYRIDDSILPRGGARVRCHQCSTIILIPAPAVVPPPTNLDLIPPMEPPRPREAAPRALAPAPLAPSSTPANAPDWLTVDTQPEAPAPARLAPPEARQAPPAPSALQAPPAPTPPPAWQEAPAASE